MYKCITFLIFDGPYVMVTTIGTITSYCKPVIFGGYGQFIVGFVQNIYVTIAISGHNTNVHAHS